MSIQVVSELTQLRAALQRYKEVSGKSWGDILAKEAREWSLELNRAFKRISPIPPAIMSAAKARSFAMGRRTNRITPAREGLSQASIASAEGLLGGEKSDYFRVSFNSDGTPVVRRLRFSGRLNKKTRVRRILMGGRRGNKFAASALRASQVEAESLQAAVERGDVRRMNLRAVATSLEIARRTAAGKGGLMGLQWLPEVYRKRSSAVMKNGPLVSRSNTNVPLGDISFQLGHDGEPISVTLTGYVPGTAEQAQEHGILQQVEAARVADRNAYIERKVREANQKAFAK